MTMNELEKGERYAALLDIYGNLLGAAERRRAQEHYYSDYSFAEIAEREHISRNAVYLSIKAAERKLDGFEDRLGLWVKKTKAQALLDRIEKTADNSERAEALAALRRLL